MLRSATFLSLMLLLVPVDLVRAQSADAETITAINTASGALHEAFIAKNADSIRSLMMPDHIAVTPYYDGPQTVDEIIASLSDLDYTETVVGEVSVVLLAPDVAKRTYVADWTGSFKGAALPTRVFVNDTLVNRNGEWLERFYQVTAMKP
jgi:hypothetical protein